MGDMSDKFYKECKIKKRSTKHSEADRKEEIGTTVRELCDKIIFEIQPG